MNQLTLTKKSIFAAVCLALCVVLPMAFHTIPGAGSIYLPMHIPVLLCGLICGWSFGLLVGILGPILSSLFTGMPPAAYLPTMIVELAVYGLVAGLLFQFIRTKKMAPDLYISLIGAMLIGRIVAGIVRALVFSPGQLSMQAWVTSYFVTGLPGIVIQILLIPAIIYALMQARLIPPRYSKGA